MNEIEQEALALLNEVRKEWGLVPLFYIEYAEDFADAAALIRSVGQHEATKRELSDFRQEVSDTVEYVIKHLGAGHWAQNNLNKFIIPKPKPDPLVEVLGDLEWCNPPALAKDLRAALGARGLEIREKNDA
jgi:hypothetical protein